MTRKLQARLPVGMRDILPEHMLKRQYVIDTIRSAFEEFGFEPLHTPAIELAETLSGKYGDEAERLIYSVTYGGSDERLALRYDLSVPLCRLMAMHPGLLKPFKRYQIAPVWRAERPQHGRYREFVQCDADTIGNQHRSADAEMVALIYTVLHRLGFRSFCIHINHRKILDGIGQLAGVPQSLCREACRAIDKLPKIGLDAVRQELLAVGLADAVMPPVQRVTRQYLQKRFALNVLGIRLRQELIPVLDGRLAHLAEQAAGAVEPALRALLAWETPGAVRPQHIQKVANQLAAGVLPVLRQVFGESRVLIPEPAVDRLLSLVTIQGGNHVILDSLRERLAHSPDALEGLSDLKEMLHYLDLLGVPNSCYAIDVSMVRGLDY
jgi:histidyl-tRNA synthetase